MYSKYQIMKILENCFQNMNYFSWIKVIPVLIHLKYWYNNSPYLELPFLYDNSVKFYPSQLKPLFNTILIMLLIDFPILSYPISLRATTRIEYIKPYVKPNQSNFFIKLYTDHNTLLVKGVTYQKTESFRAASLSELDNTSATTLPSIKSMLNSLENGRCSFIFTALHLPPLQSAPKIRTSISVNFLVPISPLFVDKVIFAIPANTPFYCSTTVFHLPAF